MFFIPDDIVKKWRDVMDTDRPSDEVPRYAVCAQELLIIIDITDVGGFQLAVLCAGDGRCYRHY